MPAPRDVVAPFVSALLALAGAAAGSAPGSGGGAGPAVAWPVSTGALLAEVVTGGAAASDEYVEVTNAGPAEVDLGGCELIYVSASGATTTRKATFASPSPLTPGQHMLIANAAGIFATAADLTYSGGLAADGGALALRWTDGTTIDAVGWGSVANAYVEGAAAPAPPAGSSLERRPGGEGGNVQDTNDNAADWLIRPDPVPQSLASAPRPDPSAAVTQTEAAGSSEASMPSAPASESTPQTPSVTDPAASPTAGPSAAEPDIDLEPVAVARAQATGTRVRVAGVVTAEPGFTGTDGLLAIQDSSAGIFVRLSNPPEGLAVGASIEVVGALAAPYGQLEIRAVEWLALGPQGGPPPAAMARLADIGEPLEGALVTVAGSIDSVQTVDGRLSLAVADGSHVLRVLADPRTGLSAADVRRGQAVALTGIVGQRATATGRLDGYRLWLRSRADVVPDPLAPTPVPTPVPTPAATAHPSSSSSPRPVLHDLAGALPIRGSLIELDATVTAPAGLFDWGGPTAVVDDGTAAVAVLLPEGDTAAASAAVGRRVHVAGKVGVYCGGPRVVASVFAPLDEVGAIDPLGVTALGPALEWRLVRVSGRIDRVIRIGIRWRIDLMVAGRSIAVLGQPAAGIAVSSELKGRLAVVTGIVRRATSDHTQFQLLPRSRHDLQVGPGPTAVSGPASTRPAAVSPVEGTAALVDAAGLEDHAGQTVTLAGLIVEVQNDVAVLDDGTGRARLGGQAAAEAIALLEPGDAVEATGLVEIDAAGPWVHVDPDRIVVLSSLDVGPEGPATASPSGPVGNPLAEGDGPGQPASAGSRAGAAGLGLLGGWSGLWYLLLGTLAVLGLAVAGLTARAAVRRARCGQEPAAPAHAAKTGPRAPGGGCDRA
jgi:hypothetical protein